jgi:hypothetical protein
MHEGIIAGLDALIAAGHGDIALIDCRGVVAAAAAD